jgi:CARDB
MRRIALLAALVGLVAPATAAAAPATVALTACQPRDRAAEFEARMDQIPGAARMKLRFTLETRRVGRAWKKVVAPELGGWRTADAQTTRYISSRRVTALVGPASYRTVVRFRWLDADGAVVAASRARSRACWQPDHRPNLKLMALSVEGGSNYLVLVANTGRSESGPFDLTITGLPTQVVPTIAPGGEALIEVAGPACEPGAPITATADPLNLIAERSERDNALTRPCP